MNTPFLVLQYPDPRKHRTVAIAFSRSPKLLQAFKNCVLEEARLETLDWNTDDILRIRSQAELSRLEYLLKRLIPDSCDG